MNVYLVEFKSRKRIRVEADSYVDNDEFFEFRVEDSNEAVLIVAKDEVLLIKGLGMGETPTSSPNQPEGIEVNGGDTAESEDSSEVS